MDSSKTRRTSRRLLEKEEQAKKKRRMDDGKMLLPSVLKLVAASDLLTTKELGRLLLLTSKSLTSSAFDHHQEVWKYICFSQWGIDDATLLIYRMGLSPEQCFRALMVSEDTFTGPRPLEYSPSDYLLLVSVSDDENGKNLFLRTIHGEVVEKFLEDGEVGVEFSSPAWSKVFNSAQEANFCLRWKATIHLMRLPDQRIIELSSFVEDERIWEEEGKCDTYWFDSESRPGPTITGTRYGRSLIRHYSERLSHGIVVEFALDYRVKSTNKENDTIAVCGLSLDARFDHLSGYFDATPVADAIKGRDVTFAHFVEALDVWND